MTDDNDTIEQVCADLRGHDLVPPPHGAWVMYANRILAAHMREMAEKDEEILNLRKSLARVMEVTGDCRKCEECGDETCPWFGEPDGCNNREGRAEFLAGKLVDPLKKKDAEIAKLRALVKELSFNLDAWVHGGRFAVTESDLEVLEKYEKEAK